MFLCISLLLFILLIGSDYTVQEIIMLHLSFIISSIFELANFQFPCLVKVDFDFDFVVLWNIIKLVEHRVMQQIEVQT